MKIFILGCSYTNGRVKNQKIIEHTWPYLLYKCTGYTVYNFAEAGSNNIFNTRLLEENLKYINPDIVIYQYAEPYRFYFYPEATSHDVWKYVEQKDDYFYFRKDLDGDFFFFGPSYYKFKYPESFITNPKKSINTYYKYFQNDMIEYIERTNQCYTTTLLQNYKTLYINWYEQQPFECNICAETDIGFNEHTVCDDSNHFSLNGNQQITTLIQERLTAETLYGIAPKGAEKT